MDHFGKTLSAMGTGHVKTAGPVTCLAAGYLAMCTVFDSVHFFAGMTTQTDFVAAIGVVRTAYGPDRQEQRFSHCRGTQHGCNKR
jgi:hypothetical protein